MLVCCQQPKTKMVWRLFGCLQVEMRTKCNSETIVLIGSTQVIQISILLSTSFDLVECETKF